MSLSQEPPRKPLFMRALDWGHFLGFKVMTTTVYNTMAIHVADKYMIHIKHEDMHFESHYGRQGETICCPSL